MRQLHKYNNNSLFQQVVRFLFTERILRNKTIFPELLVRMPYLNTHQPDQVHRRNPIIFSFTILLVIRTTGIAYAPLEPVPVFILLHLHNEHHSIFISAHKVIMELLVHTDNWSLMFCRQIVNADDPPVFRQKCVDDRHHFRFVVLISEERLESAVAQYVDIPLLRLPFLFLSFHMNILMVIYFHRKVLENLTKEG